MRYDALNIVVLEKSPNVTKDLQEKLNHLKHCIIAVFETGEEGFAKIDELNPDLVLVGLQLSGELDGIETGSKIKSKFNLPIIYLVAEQEEALLPNTIKMDPHRYFIKYSSQRELSLVIEGTFYRFNIEKQQQSEQNSLQEKTEYFRGVYEKSPTGIAIVDTKTQRIIQANKSYQQIIGYSEEELQKLTVKDLTHPEDWITETQLIESYLNGEVDEYLLEKRYIHKDGSIRWVRMSGDVLLLGQSKTPLAIANVVDITEQKTAEQNLQESQNRYKMLIDTLPYGVEEVDIEGRMIFLNDSYCRLLGYEKDEITNKYIWDQEPDSESIIRLKEFFKYLIHHQPDPVPYFTKSKRKDGTLIDVQVDWNYKYDENRRLKGFIAIVTDITERIQAEKQLRESEKKYRDLVEVAPYLIAIHVDKNIIYINKAGAKLLGAANPEDVLGKNVTDYVVPQNKSQSEERIKQFINSKNNIAAFEQKLRKSNGEIIDIEVIGTKFEYQGRDAVQIIAYDITERKNLLRLKDQKNIETRALLKASNSVLLYKDFNKIARIIFDCCREVTGATSGYVALLSDDEQENEVLFLESGGLSCTVDPSLPMPVRGLRAKAYQTKLPVYDNDFWNGQWQKYLPDGHVLLKNVLFSPILLNEKSVGLIGIANKASDFNEDDVNIVKAFTDIISIALQNKLYLDHLNQSIKSLELSESNLALVNEKLKEALIKAKESDKLKSAFLANISHEIRTPLNGILGFTDLLLDENLTYDQKEQLNYIKENGKLLLSIITDILDISRIEAGQLIIKKEKFSIKELTMYIKALADNLINKKQKNIDFELHISKDIEDYIIGDAVKIKQVINNIISNAIKFTEQGKVSCHLKLKSKDTLQFIIEDTGIGIPRNKWEKIFLPFHQVDEKITIQYGGTGLGLAICKKLTEAMGGDISLTSKEGIGSTFYITLPYIPATSNQSI